MQRLQRSVEMARALAAVRLSEVTPSRRDFSQYVATQRRGLAVLAKLAATVRDLPTLARQWDDAEVAALAFEDLAIGPMLAACVTAPLFWDFPLIDSNQVYHARLQQADAVLLPATHLGADGVQELVALANSMHMASVVEIADAAELGIVPQRPPVVIGVRRGPALHAVAQKAPRRQAIVLLDEVESLAQCRELAGVVDAVVLGALLESSDDVAALVSDLSS